MTDAKMMDSPAPGMVRSWDVRADVISVDDKVRQMSAACPFCRVVNIARLQDGDIDEEDKILEWWTGAKSGTWCPHCCGFFDECGRFCRESSDELADMAQMNRDMAEL